LKGIDISNNNGSVCYKGVIDSGVECVYMKATEGATYVDATLNENYECAREQALKIGFYHFLVGTSSPEDQADNFYNQIKDKTMDLVPILDVETNFENLMDYVHRFINKFAELSGLTIGIYTYSGFMENLDDSLAGFLLWEANYNNDPWNLPKNNIWGQAAGHQYTDKGSVNGIDGNVDLNQFNDDILLEKLTGYVVTNYLPNGSRGDGSFIGVDIQYVKEYFKDIDIFVRGNDKGVWVETKILPMDKCRELQETIGSWFYCIK
jgi:GH25 family lysozyme M1 (1,4-beta-N-acetylmuramidase)